MLTMNLITKYNRNLKLIARSLLFLCKMPPLFGYLLPRTETILLKPGLEVNVLTDSFDTIIDTGQVNLEV